MDTFVIGCLGFGLMLGLIFLGVPIAFAGSLVGLIGLWAIGGINVTLHFLGSIPYSDVAFYPYTAIPLYVLLGEFANSGGYAHGLFRTGREWVGKLPGGLSIAAILGGAGFGAVCGSSVAASAVLGRICIPEMRKFGYDRSLAAGTVASCANLSSLIPPSGLMIIYSIFTAQSLGKLLVAGILPGILLSFLFSASVYARVSLNPKLAPIVAEPTSWRRRFISLRYGTEIFIIAAVVSGGIYTGVFTAIEAGGAGAFVAFLLTLRTRLLSWTKFKDALLTALKTTVMVLFIIVGIMVFTHFLTLARVPLVVSSFLAGLPVSRLTILLLIVLFYLFLGMFFDAISIIALTIPVLYPTVVALGYDPIWFGVMTVLLCEIGLITPPVGVNCFVVASVAPDITLEEVFRGIMPFLIPNFIMVAILIAFPKIALFLPNLMTK